MFDPKYLNIDAKDVLPDNDTLSRYLGYENKNHDFISILEEILSESQEKMDIQAGYRMMTEKVLISGGLLKIDGTDLEPGKVICGELLSIEGVIIFALTLGTEFDNWSRTTFNSGDPARGYIIDSTGSITAENTAEFLHNFIKKHLQKAGLKCTNKFSPGYCGWNVAQQKSLLSLLPEEFCGISLTESALMKPLKSISGIIGIGKNVEHLDYPCSECSKPDCQYSSQEGRYAKFS